MATFLYVELRNTDIAEKLYLAFTLNIIMNTQFYAIQILR